jgi:hypothetical protein
MIFSAMCRGHFLAVGETWELDQELALDVLATVIW